jgi:hypothetical protein
MPTRESFARVDSCWLIACNGNLHAREQRSETSPSPAKFGSRERSRNSCRTRSPPAANHADMLPADQPYEWRHKLAVRIKPVDQRLRSRVNKPFREDFAARARSRLARTKGHRQREREAVDLELLAASEPVELKRLASSVH